MGLFPENQALADIVFPTPTSVPTATPISTPSASGSFKCDYYGNTNSDGLGGTYKFTKYTGTINEPYGLNGPNPGETDASKAVAPQYFSATFSGWFEVPGPNSYYCTFSSKTNDGVKMTIDGSSVIGENQYSLNDGVVAREATVQLKGGKHFLVLNYFNGPAEGFVDLQWKIGNGSYWLVPATTPPPYFWSIPTPISTSSWQEPMLYRNNQLSSFLPPGTDLTQNSSTNRILVDSLGSIRFAVTPATDYDHWTYGAIQNGDEADTVLYGWTSSSGNQPASGTPAIERAYWTLPTLPAGSTFLDALVQCTISDKATYPLDKSPNDGSRDDDDQTLPLYIRIRQKIWSKGKLIGSKMDGTFDGRLRRALDFAC